MACYRPTELGEVQKQILKHFFLCKENKRPESVSHIAKELRVLQPSVYRSVDLLIKEKYLLKDNDFTRKSGQKYVERDLIVTGKGAAAAVISGISNDDIINYFTRRKSKYILYNDEIELFQKFKQIAIKEPDKQNLLIKKMMEYFLNNNYFDEIGGAKDLSADEFKMLLTYVAIEYNNAVGKPRTIRDLVDKYSLDKKQLKDILEKEKSRIDSIIRQLED
jgi:hypothetical protein